MVPGDGGGGYKLWCCKREENEAAGRLGEVLAREACSGFPLVQYKRLVFPLWQNYPCVQISSILVGRKALRKFLMLAQQLTRSLSVGRATNTLATKFTAFTQTGTRSQGNLCRVQVLQINLYRDCKCQPDWWQIMSQAKSSEHTLLKFLIFNELTLYGKGRILWTFYWSIRYLVNVKSVRY